MVCPTSQHLETILSSYGDDHRTKGRVRTLYVQGTLYP
jgi:hypothetical protein